MGFGLGFRVRVRVRIRVRVRVRRTPSVLNTEWMAAKEDIRLREAWRCPAAAEAPGGPGAFDGPSHVGGRATA